MLKLIGLFFVMAATTGAGFYYSRRFSARPVQIRRLIQAIQILESEISFRATPIKEAMHIIGGRFNQDPTGDIFLSAHDLLSSQPSRSFQAIWREVLAKQFSNTSLKEQEREILLQLGDQLGLSNRADQIKHLQLAMQHLKINEEEARWEKARYEKMCRSLGFLAGLLIAILLI
jgi:stage III sporulation protein AB